MSHQSILVFFPADQSSADQWSRLNNEYSADEYGLRGQGRGAYISQGYLLVSIETRTRGET